jgi:hypothetical protein
MLVSGTASCMNVNFGKVIGSVFHDILQGNGYDILHNCQLSVYRLCYVFNIISLYFATVLSRVLLKNKLS